MNTESRISAVNNICNKRRIALMTAAIFKSGNMNRFGKRARTSQPKP